MAITIDENIILFTAGAIFIPVFIFFIKMIMEIGTIKSKVDAIDNFLKDSKAIFERYRLSETELKVMESKLSHIESEIAYIHKIHREEHPESNIDDRFERDRDRNRNRGGSGAAI